jgi:hypothetical protein
MEEIILFNEAGKHIHLYKNSGTGLWTAYGYSAYKVAEMRKRQNHVPIVENYSEKMLMPVVVFGDDTFKHIAGLCRCEEENPDYTRLTIPNPALMGTDGYSQMGTGLERKDMTAERHFQHSLRKY